MERGIRFRRRALSLHLKPGHKAHCRSQMRLAMGSLRWPKKRKQYARQREENGVTLAAMYAHTRRRFGSTIAATPNTLVI